MSITTAGGDIPVWSHAGPVCDFDSDMIPSESLTAADFTMEKSHYLTLFVHAQSMISI